MASIQLKNVRFQYDPKNADADSFCSGENLIVEEGEFLCITGPSGCGKTTMLKLIAGLLAPTEGTILINGQPLHGPCRDAAVVFQEYTLFPWLTARKNIEFGITAARKDISRRDAADIADEYLRKVSMSDAAEKHPYQMSGGMRQRIAIARALAMNTDILFLDEPFGALDPGIRKELQDLLLDLWNTENASAETGSRHKKTILFVTHEVKEALLLADRILFLQKGSIMAEIPVLLPRPRKNLSYGYQKRFNEIRDSLEDLYLQNITGCTEPIRCPCTEKAVPYES